MFVGGIEGGATHSKLVIFNEVGVAVTEITGPGTNHWMCGIPECARRIAKMVADAKATANIPDGVRLKALGLSLSGCEQEATNKELEGELHKVHGHVAESYVICSDTLGRYGSHNGQYRVSHSFSLCIAFILHRKWVALS